MHNARGEATISASREFLVEFLVDGFSTLTRSRNILEYSMIGIILRLDLILADENLYRRLFEDIRWRVSRFFESIYSILLDLHAKRIVKAKLVSKSYIDQVRFEWIGLLGMKRENCLCRFLDVERNIYSNDLGNFWISSHAKHVKMKIRNAIIGIPFYLNLILHFCVRIISRNVTRELNIS